ncbi:putative helicase mov-10-B.1 [Aulostomus maculatus]
MTRMSLKSRRQVGLDFFAFLNETDRESTTERLELRTIYNEFRGKHADTKYPSFGSVLFALKEYNIVTRKRDQIVFSLSVRASYVDQWYNPRSRQQHPGQNGAARPLPGQSLPSAETEAQVRRKQASRLMKKLRKDRNKLIADRNGVTITSDYEIQNGKLHLTLSDTWQSVITLNVKNSGTKTVHFTYYTALHWLKYITLHDERNVTRTNPLALLPGDSYEIEVHFQCHFVGFYPATLAFEFKPDLQPSSAAFHIVRDIEAHCITSLGQELGPVAPYRCCPIRVDIPQTQCKIVDGQRPEGMSVMQLKNEVALKQYKIPEYIPQLIQALKRLAVSPQACFSDNIAALENPLSMANYSKRFQLLLYLEGHQMEVDIRRYNIPNNETPQASMKRDPANKKLLILEVPGVSENRPSVLRGDKLLVYPEGEAGVKYCGYVHSVQLDNVKLGLSSELLDKFIDGMKFHVEFIVNHIALRVQHRAAEMASTCRLGHVLFPAAPASSPRPAPPNLRLFDSLLQRNPQQYEAIKHIVAGSSKPAPYLVFGPPGTGKTVTLVEAIKQIEKTQISCHILACAPSNSAADLLCKKTLDHVDEHKVFRMYASSRDPQCVPDELKACSNLVGDCYVFPAKEKLMEYKIVVTTLITAGRLVSGNIPEGHFTHVFVDEAGQAVETECIVPLAGLLQAQTGQLVLAGDPKQLGPILRSPFALKYHLGVSFLERMMTEFPLYQKKEGEFNNHYVTKLLRNYRSHPDILRIPNELFYDGELEYWADEILRNSFCSWQYLPRTGFPLIFHGVTGLDQQEASSPSYFNVAEVEVLMDYVRKLLEPHGKKGHGIISPQDIGIIAPYRKQVQKIRKALQKVGKDFKFKNMSTLKVGSVEEFQGQERRVILVSTVRSSQHYADIDKEFNLGFVKNEKRFNVAVTRAKALLIVVGNPIVLRVDPVWNRFIEHCKDHGGYTGYMESEEDNDVVLRLCALSIRMELTEETEESAVQQLQDPEWRGDM